MRVKKATAVFISLCDLAKAMVIPAQSLCRTRYEVSTDSGRKSISLHYRRIPLVREWRVPLRHSFSSYLLSYPPRFAVLPHANSCGATLPQTEPDRAAHDTNKLRAVPAKFSRLSPSRPESLPQWSLATIRSATMSVGRLVLARGTVGMMEASTTWRPSRPWTLPTGSTTASGSEVGPILQVPTGWK